MTIGLTDELFSGIQPLLIASNVRLTPSLTVRDAGHLLTQEAFHLLIVDLEYLRSIGQTEWLFGIRRISFIPVIVLSDTPEKDLHSMIQLGVDLCVSGGQSHSLVADLSFAQVRRYTEYNHYRTPPGIAPAPFRIGDISIDFAHHTAEIRGRTVSLRSREFNLLRFFMENPGIILSSEQICEHAWGTEGIYHRGVAQAIYLLRKAIEPDPENPVYIETVRRLGYRLTAKEVKTCDKCDSCVSIV